MAVVTDMVVIQGDTDRRIGDGAVLWEQSFRTDNRDANGNAVLMLMVKGLTYADQPVEIKINDIAVGHLFPSRWHDNAHRDAAAEHWSTQIVNVQGRNLRNGDNELQILAAGYPEATGGNAFDDFYVRDVVCFYQQGVAALPGE